MVETGCRALGAGRWVLGIPVGAGDGRRELACRCSVLASASDSEVITVSGDQAPLLTMKCQQSWAA